MVAGVEKRAPQFQATINEVEKICAVDFGGKFIQMHRGCSLPNRGRPSWH